MNAGLLSTHSFPPLSFPLPPLAYCPLALTTLSSGWDRRSSRLPQTGLRAPMALVILCGFGNVTAAWLIYGTLITPPPGGHRGAQRETSREVGVGGGGRGPSVFTWELLSSGQFTQRTDNHF